MNSTIQRIVVKRKANTLVYMPEWMTGLLQEDSVVISILYEDARGPQFLSTMDVLTLRDEGMGLTPEHFHGALRFAKQHRGKNINIHCYTGQQRSKWLAEQLASVFSEYTILKHQPDGVLLDVSYHVPSYK